MTKPIYLEPGMRIVSKSRAKRGRHRGIVIRQKGDRVSWTCDVCKNDVVGIRRALRKLPDRKLTNANYEALLS